VKIALALSGGGFRATVFHLGVLARLAEEDKLEEVDFVSTNSGGTLCAGLVFTLANSRWPTSGEYLDRVLPEARRLLTTKDLQRALIFRFLGTFWTVLETRADDLSAMMRKHWGIDGSLRDLPENPRWMINAACHETGVNWRFERFRMGDYVFGYSDDTDLPLSDAMAASAGFPGLVGPLVLDATQRSWYKYMDDDAGVATGNGDPGQPQRRTWQPVQPPFPEVHLWDGGVYDNHGLEALHNFDTGWREGVDFLIVSDAAGRPTPEEYRRGVKALLRIVTDITMNQVRSLRSRAVLERMRNHEDKGAFLQTGNTCADVLTAAGKADEIPQLCPPCLPAEAATRAAEMPTVIRKLTNDEFALLFRHGYEVADYTLYAWHPDTFSYIGFDRSRWGPSG
jgi:NTE family protein